MPFFTVNLGLQLSIPTQGTRNWGPTLLENTWKKISGHDHSGSGNGTQIGPAGLADGSVTTPKIADYAVTAIKLAKNLGSTVAATLLPTGLNATQNIDWNNGTKQKVDLAGATGALFTFTLSNPVAGAKYTILIVNSALQPTVSWPAAVKWINGTPLEVTGLLGAVDKVELYYDGANYYGDWDTNYA